MVSESIPTRFTLDPARADEFIEDLSAVENSLRHVAEKWNTTTGALSLFLASPEGLAIVAAAEIATAVHIRLQAQALLVDVAQSMVYIVREYSREERRIPFNNDLRSIKLVELRRANARRAGNLLLRLAHYNPAPIRSYTVRPVAEQSDQTCGMPKRPLGHGEAADLEPVPPVRRSGATGVLNNVATQDSSVPSGATEIDGSASISMQDDQDAPFTSTSDSAESASEIVVHVGAANTSLLRELASHSPQDCSKAVGVETTVGGAYPRTASHELCTPKRSAPPQTPSTPPSDSGP